MDFKLFQERFECAFPLPDRWEYFADQEICPDVRKSGGSFRIQQFLSLAVGCLEGGECYLEVGTFEGQSVISALSRNPGGRGFVCDNFSYDNSEETLFRNLEAYKIRERVTLLKGDFRQLLNKQEVKFPVGLYFYDGDHTVEGHKEGLLIVEPLLAPQAMVVIDDWREDKTQQGTVQALERVVRRWETFIDIPSRINGQGTWWHGGLGVFRVTDN